jgi:membrane fusion protein (multidrug efflux system)
MILADDSVYPFGGSLNFVDRTVDRNTSTLPFRLEFPNPSGILRPGQFARLLVVLEDRKDALLIPQRAVQENMEGQAVFIVDENNTVERRRVVAGPRQGSRWVIEKGLQPGETVVVEGLQRVRPGIQVNPSSVSQEIDTTEAAATPKSLSGPDSKKDLES